MDDQTRQSKKAENLRRHRLKKLIQRGFEKMKRTGFFPLSDIFTAEARLERLRRDRQEAEEK